MKTKIRTKDESAAAGLFILLSREGGSVDDRQAAKLLGGSQECSVEVVHNAADSGHLIAVRDRTGNTHYPIWQFGPKGGVLPGIPEVLAILAPHRNQLAPVTFCLNISGRLGGLSPLQVLRIGGRHSIERVMRLAEESLE